MQRKFDKVQVEDENIRCMEESTCNTLLQAANYALDGPITMDDLYFAVKKGKTPSSWQWRITTQLQLHMRGPSKRHASKT